MLPYSLAALGEDLDAGVDGVGVEIVVGVLFAVEVDGGGAGDLGLRGHGELFRGGRGPLIGVSGDGKGGQEETRSGAGGGALGSLRGRHEGFLEELARIRGCGPG